MAGTKTTALDAFSIKTHEDLKQFLDKNTDQIESAKSIRISSEVAQNLRKGSFRQLILKKFKQQKLFLACVEEIQKNDGEFILSFTEQNSPTVIFKGVQGEKAHSVKNDPGSMVEMGLRQYMIFSAIQSMVFDDQKMVPLETVADPIWNGGAKIGKNTDPEALCITSTIVNQNQFIFKSTDIPRKHLSAISKMKCGKHTILISGFGKTRSDIGVPALIVDTETPINVNNAVLALNLKPEVNTIGYLLRLVRFIRSAEFQKQIFPQYHDKSVSLSIKNLRIAMVPDPAVIDSNEPTLINAVKSLEKADLALKECKKVCDCLFSPLG